MLHTAVAIASLGTWQQSTCRCLCDQWRCSSSCINSSVIIVFVSLWLPTELSMGIKHLQFGRYDVRWVHAETAVRQTFAVLLHCKDGSLVFKCAWWHAGRSDAHISMSTPGVVKHTAKPSVSARVYGLQKHLNYTLNTTHLLNNSCTSHRLRFKLINTSSNDKTFSYCSSPNWCTRFLIFRHSQRSMLCDICKQTQAQQNFCHLQK